MELEFVFREEKEQVNDYPVFGRELPRPPKGRRLYKQTRGRDREKDSAYWVFRLEGKRVKYSHYVWNTFYKDDPVVPGKGYVIHHKNHNSLDDRISNLEKVKFTKHIGEHHKGKKVSAETRRKISEAGKGRKLSPEHRQAILDANIGRKCSTSTKKKISKSNTGKKRSKAVREAKSRAMKEYYRRNPDARERSRQAAKKAWKDGVYANRTAS